MANNRTKRAAAASYSIHNENRGFDHYNPHMTQAEYIAAQMTATRKRKPRQPKPVTLREFSWMR